MNKQNKQLTPDEMNFLTSPASNGILNKIQHRLPDTKWVVVIEPLDGHGYLVMLINGIRKKLYAKDEGELCEMLKKIRKGERMLGDEQ